MTGSVSLMTESKLIEKLNALFRIKPRIQRRRRVWIKVSQADLVAIAHSAKELGFIHLSSISVTDWPQQNIFELIYHIWSYKDIMLLSIVTNIGRDEPISESVSPIWRNAQIHEREIHELFGVSFKGNHDLTPLFLEDWDGPPPFRKDFDWREHVREKNYDFEDDAQKSYWQELPYAFSHTREPIPELPLEERLNNFRQVELGLNVEAVNKQAQRCLQCGDSPCIHACPAHLNIKKYVLEAAKGNYRDGLDTILERLPFPASIGRICPHPCEEQCALVHQFLPVSVRAIKRFLADEYLDTDWYPKVNIRKGDQIAIIGGGPAGLTVARNLALSCYPVTVFDLSSHLGGMFVLSIPSYRLPKEIPMKEVEEIRKLGVKFKQADFGTDLTIKSLFDQGYKAIFLGIGAHGDMKMNIPGENLKGVYEALGLLKDIKLGKPIPDFNDKKVLVVGGGNVAMDIARSTLRLGAQVKIIYRRSLQEIPASHEEVQAAEEEGVVLNLLTNPSEILGDGRVQQVDCIRMKLGDPDTSGRRHPIPIEGSNFRIDTDYVIEAIGQTPISGALKSMGIALSKRGLIEVDQNMKTNLDGVFAGGDVVTGPSIAIEAVAGGIKAADSMKNYLESR